MNPWVSVYVCERACVRILEYHTCKMDLQQSKNFWRSPSACLNPLINRASWRDRWRRGTMRGTHRKRGREWGKREACKKWTRSRAAEQQKSIPLCLQVPPTHRRLFVLRFGPGLCVWVCGCVWGVVSEFYFAEKERPKHTGRGSVVCIHTASNLFVKSLQGSSY